MPARIFITGAAGYVGGQTTGYLMSAHPEYEVVALVRNEEQALKVKGRWPEVNTVIGTLDDHAILRQESTKAAVVLQLASSDHISCIEPLISGLATSGGKMVHISGTGVLNDASTGFGNPAPKIFDDVKDIEEITSLDQSALHRNVDDAVITGGKQHNVSTAIICPPLIYGIGEGPVKKRSIQIPFLTEAILKRGRAFTVGDGKNVWDHIHVSDVAKACVFLVEEALKPQGSAQWESTGYYFVESGEFAWREVSEAIAELAKEEGKLETADVDPLSVDEALRFHPWASVLWGGNCRSRASRLRSMGWKPEGPTLWEALPAMVKAEIAALKP